VSSEPQKPEDNLDGIEDSMTQTLTFPVVTGALLDDIVGRILSAGSPEKIVLFGSRSRGEARPDSDLDLLIIEESGVPRHRRAGRYRMALLGLFPAKDIVVWTPSEVAAWRDVPNAFITTILAEGKVLYERSRDADSRLAAQSR
jgi:predicted nucleotidyltransferase